ncbi:MAG: MFS transporter [Hyphomonadaceae bacterium]
MAEGLAPLDSHAAPTPSVLAQIGVTTLGFLIIMADGYDLQSIGFVAPEIARARGLELSEFAPVFAAGLFGTIPGAMAAGPISRLLGERPTLILSLFVFGAGTLACALNLSVESLVGTRFIVGLGLGVAIPVTMSVIAARTNVRARATIVTLALCGQPLGAIVGAALSSRLIPTYGWQAAFVVGGVLPLALIVFVFLLPRASNLSSDRSGAERVRDLAAPSIAMTTLFLWSVSFINVLLLYVVVNWLPGIVQGAGYSLQQSLVVISLFNAGGIIGALSVAALIDRFGVFRIVPGVFLLAACLITSLSLALHDFSALELASFASGVAAYGGGASIGAMALMLYPAKLRTTGVGWTLGVGRLGGALGPIGVTGLLSVGLAPGDLFYAAGALAALASGLMLFFASLRARHVVSP